VCHTKQIPEDTLIATTAEALGVSEFSEELFNEQIKEIRVPEFNHLIFVFYDGQEIEKVWQDRSRRESWTPEMRQIAHHHALKTNKTREDITV